MTAIKQMNVDYQQEISRLVESENQYKQKTANIAKEREENFEELTKLREQFRMQKGYVECSACLDIFVEPVTLECTHTFCKTCFENTSRNAGMHAVNQPATPCPLCRRMTSARVTCLALKNLAACLSSDQERPRPPTSRVEGYLPLQPPLPGPTATSVRFSAPLAYVRTAGRVQPSSTH